ncbi:MAG: class I SAM-dependent methyltransferase [Pseudomonadota bacterium]
MSVGSVHMNAELKQPDGPPNRQQYWEHVYADRSDQDLSWYQSQPELSLELIQFTGLDRKAAIIDIGGGSSALVDVLLQAGYERLSVLDIAENALQRAQQRLGQRASAVDWIRADVTAGVDDRVFSLWHDRAVFHFLVNEEDRVAYLRALAAGLRPDGFLIIATFAPDGPAKCSGLPVQRYSPESLSRTLGRAYRLLDTRLEDHRTPAGKVQHFVYCLFQRVAE